MWWLAAPIGASFIGIGFAAYLARWVFSQDDGTAAMRKVSGAIFEGAQAFLRRQYQTIALLALGTSVVIGFLLAILTNIAHTSTDPAWIVGIRTALAFLFGAFCSGLSGYIGMQVAVRSNIRTASAARRGLGDALRISLWGGAVSGFLVITLSLLGVTIVYVAVGGLANPLNAPFAIVGYGFGASFVALFAQLGGGIYTKAADVGADLVGKVEAGIPEDDPRNPAVIADLVGDNVGDCAGRGADLFESTAAETVGAMILGAALFPVFGIKGILFPLIIHAINRIASIVGVAVVRSSETEDPMRALNRGFYVTAAIALAGLAVVVYKMLNGPGVRPGWLRACGVVGLVTAFLFVWITQYYTEAQYRPVQLIAESSLTGPATNIISGLAVGMETPALPVIVISIALLASYYCGIRALANATDINGNVLIISDYAKGIYGTAIATMGMLATAAYILAMDTFGPITDNAGGIIEMSHQPDSVREK